MYTEHGGIDAVHSVSFEASFIKLSFSPTRQAIDYPCEEIHHTLLDAGSYIGLLERPRANTLVTILRPGYRRILFS